MAVIKKRIMALTTLQKEDEKNDLEASLLSNENPNLEASLLSDGNRSETNRDLSSEFETEKEEVKIVSLSRLLRLANGEWRLGIVALIALLISTVSNLKQ
jgi:hypothetical protein